MHSLSTFFAIVFFLESIIGLAYVLEYGIITASAHTAGAYGTYWQTDLYLFNATEQAVDVTLKFYSGDNKYVNEVVFNIGSMKGLEMKDIVKETFEYEGMGMIILDASNITNPENPENV